VNHFSFLPTFFTAIQNGLSALYARKEEKQDHGGAGDFGVESEESAMPEDPGEVTQLLRKLNRGDPEAADRLIPLIYGELRALAARSMRSERPNHTLQATALVHEAFLRLVDQRKTGWQNRAQFFAVAARIMRHVLLDHARRRLTAKRGAGRNVPLDEFASAAEQSLDQIVFISECLDRLAALDLEQSRIVEMQFFAGLTVEEMAHVLHRSPMTVKRQWASAKAWLYREMTKRDSAQGAKAEPAGQQ
jgi:RNA polymerase sigma factor (TIGR02999 family)